MSNKAIITGVLGQDGSYMAELLSQKKYDVTGIINPHTHNKDNRIRWIKKLVPSIKILERNLSNRVHTFDLVENIKPDEIYNFAGYSNVFNPWDNLDSVYEVNCKIPQNFLEAVSNLNRRIKFFQASSCLIYGRSKTKFQHEKTPFAPLYPYGITKLYAHNLVTEFREKYNIFACSAIFFNHESERRGNNFFTQKIICAIGEIIKGKRDKVAVGDLSSFRDMGYAPDFMDASFLMMQNNIPADYVVGTGKLIKMEEFVSKSFKAAGLNWRDHITHDKQFERPKETLQLRADIKKIKKELGWHPTQTIDNIIDKMLNSQQEEKI